jgi:uncharacterized protein YuzE
MSDINFKGEYKYDMEVDGLFLYVKEDYDYETSVELDNDVMLDFDKNGIPVALEILNASRVLKAPKYSLNKIRKIRMTVGIDEKSINLKLAIKVLVHNKKLTQSVDTFTSNDIGMPNSETELAAA